MTWEVVVTVTEAALVHGVCAGTSWRVQRRVANRAGWVAGDVMLPVPVPAGDLRSAGGSNEGFDQHAVRPGGWWSKAMLVLSVSNGSMSSHFLGWVVGMPNIVSSATVPPAVSVSTSLASPVQFAPRHRCRCRGLRATCRPGRAAARRPRVAPQPWPRRLYRRPRLRPPQVDARSVLRLMPQ